ncbi:hypothetical protein FZX09_02730 [Synechococcus sp. MU1643]|nr:hypothetical protein [Synechococcus sp. MU1643]
MPWLAFLCQGCSCTHNHPWDKTCLKRRNRQIQDNLHLVQPIARHYAQQTGLENGDLLQVGCLGLIKDCNRYDALRGETFQASPSRTSGEPYFISSVTALV